MPSKVVLAKMFIFGAVALYLVGDLFLFKGPLWRASYTPPQPLPPEVRAKVFNERITQAQLDRYTLEQNRAAGREEATPGKKQELLAQLVCDAHLRMRVRYNSRTLPDMRDAAADEVARLASRYPSEEAFAAALESQGYTREEFTSKLAVRLQELALIERTISPFAEVDDTATDKHYRKLQAALVVPECRRVRHIFLATLNKDPQAVKAALDALAERIRNGEDFASVAKSASEDERTAPLGGELGMIANATERPLPELPLFGEQAIPAGVPTAAQSKWGWHLLLADEIQPARALSADECRESLRTAIISAQREIATERYFSEVLRDGIQHKKIEFNYHVK